MLAETGTRLRMNMLFLQASANEKGRASEFPALLAPVCTSMGTAAGKEQVSACPEPTG